jgi:hypothetical protein
VAKNIRDVKVMTIRPVTGHPSVGGMFPADFDFINREPATFLDVVTEGGKKFD